MKLEFSRQIFEKFSNIKFHENPSNERRIFTWGRTDTTKLIVAFRNSGNALKINKEEIQRLYEYSNEWRRKMIVQF